jgi:hypothetical protein
LLPVAISEELFARQLLGILDWDFGTQGEKKNENEPISY